MREVSNCPVQTVVKSDLCCSHLVLLDTFFTSTGSVPLFSACHKTIPAAAKAERHHAAKAHVHREYNLTPTRPTGPEWACARTALEIISKSDLSFGKNFNFQWPGLGLKFSIYANHF